MTLSTTLRYYNRSKYCLPLLTAIVLQILLSNEVKWHNLTSVVRIVITSVTTRSALCSITGLKRNFRPETLYYRSEALQCTRGHQLAMATNNERNILAKLEAIKEIR